MNKLCEACAEMKSYMSKQLLLMAVLLLTVACSQSPEDAVDVDELPRIYPDYVGVTIPVVIAPLNFSMADDGVTAIDVEVRGSRGGTIHAYDDGDYKSPPTDYKSPPTDYKSPPTADFDIDEWHRLLADNRGDSLTVTVCAEKDGRWTRYRDFAIHVSRDSIGAWGITYRLIPPGYEMYGQMGLYQRCLANFDESALLTNAFDIGTCLNCHTPNATNPDQYVFHARGSHGGTVIWNAKGKAKSDGLDVLQSKNDSLGGAMVYPCWHPGGRYIAFSTNKTSQMFHLSGKKRIEVYDSSSDVFVYDLENHTILQDTLIMKKLWAENTPAFSPDGQWLYFTTARRQVYPTDYDKERYSLCRVSFDETTGSIGQTVDTLVSTDRTGKSVTWPRPSYDGRYLMYTQADYGYFSIWHPEADLWLLDLRTGKTRPLDELNSERAESLHSWSANSRWFLFTSRRDDGLYTRVYFASIDEHGCATKPFMLPQRNPKVYYRRLLDSYNTPDFCLRPVTTDTSIVISRLKSGERIATTLGKGN